MWSDDAPREPPPTRIRQVDAMGWFKKIPYSPTVSLCGNPNAIKGFPLDFRRKLDRRDAYSRPEDRG